MSTNTNDKKKGILNAAIYLFSNKGYSSTSVQDIATYCNISKATIYKLFSSKEEILVEIIKYFNNHMLTLMEGITLNQSLSAKEKFVEQIYTLLSHFATKKDFTITLIQNQDSFRDSIVEQAFKESKLFLLSWLRNCIYSYFGDEIETVIWDLTYTLMAMIKEFSHIFIMKRVVEKDFRDVAKYIVNSIIYIAEKHKDEDPLIPIDSLKFLCPAQDFKYDKDFLLTQWKNEIKEIRHTISNSFSLVENKDLTDCLNHLDLEFNKDDRKNFIIEALLLYLNNFVELQTHVNYLKKIWKKLK